MAYHFEWERRKAASNAKKHGVTFEEASTVFSAPLAFIFDDEDHSRMSNGKSSSDIAVAGA